MILTFVYCREGKAVTEFNYKEWLDEVCTYYNKDFSKANLEVLAVTYEVSTELAFLAIRREVAEGRINHKDIKFVIEGKEYLIGEDTQPIEPMPFDIFRAGYNMVCDINRAIRKRELQNG